MFGMGFIIGALVLLMTIPGAFSQAAQDAQNCYCPLFTTVNIPVSIHGK